MNSVEFPLTDKQYVANDGLRCPFCFADDIRGESFNVENGYVYQEVSCGECGESWEDLYQLVGYIKEEPETDEIHG